MLTSLLSAAPVHHAHKAGHFLDAEEELALIRAFQRGNPRAGDKLMRAHLGLVTSIAHDYRLWGAQLDDLIQQGSIGLLKAVQRFDPKRAPSLRAYAGYWIRAEVRDYVVRCYRMVRLGSTRTERKALRTFRVHDVKTPAELAQRSGMPLGRCEQLWPLLARGDSHVDGSQTWHLSLDRFTHDAQNPEVLVLRDEHERRTRQRVQLALAQLSERERRIVEARMMAEEPCTLEQLGAELGLSRERVRQLESVAKVKVKQSLTNQTSDGIAA